MNETQDIQEIWKSRSFGDILKAPEGIMGTLCQEGDAKQAIKDSSLIWHT